MSQITSIFTDAGARERAFWNFLTNFCIFWVELALLIEFLHWTGAEGKPKYSQIHREMSAKRES